MLLNRNFAETWLSAKKRAEDYGKDEDGSIIAFSLFIFFAMILFGGIAVDLMLYENERTNIQNSTDRAVLAAANLNQTVDPKDVVVDYLAKVGIEIERDDVKVREVGTAPVITGRQVSVTVESKFDTVLMNLVGVEQLPYAARSEAEESVKDVEVSLVLDVSGSMGDDGKLGKLKTASKSFVSGILQGSSDNRVSVSLVPYSTQVSAGPDLMAQLPRINAHGHSHCVNFDQNDFSSTSLPTVLDQTAAFDPWRGWSWGRSLRYPVCRNASYLHIRPWSNNATAINDQIDTFQAAGNTSIDVAMKWGVALLDPDMNDELVALNPADDDIQPLFDSRPRAFTYPDSLKFIVLMTDGINTTQYRMKNAYKNGMTKYFLTTRTLSDGTIEETVYMQSSEPGYADDDDTPNEPWYNLSDRRWEPDPGAKTQLNWIDFWARITVSRYAYAEYHQTGNTNDYWSRLNEPYVAIQNDPSTYADQVANHDAGGSAPDSDLVRKDQQLAAICNAAKDEGIIVFTIGFEVTDHSADVMRSCAWTPHHFYRVEGLDINAAFASIKNQINKLKLTQ